MNQGNRNGEAYGFSLFTLNKLIEIKSGIDKSFSMLHFLVNTIERKFPDLLNLPEELKIINQVSGISLEVLQSDLNAIEAGFELFKREFESPEVDHNHAKNEMHMNLLRNFYYANIKSVENLNKNFADMRQKFSRTAKYFGDDKIKFDEFFTLFHKFLDTFTSIRTELKQKHQRRIERQTSEINNSLSKNKRFKLKNPNNSIFENTTKDQIDFDNLMSNVSSGAVYLSLNKQNQTLTRRRSTNNPVSLIRFDKGRELT